MTTPEPPATPRTVRRVLRALRLCVQCGERPAVYDDFCKPCFEERRRAFISRAFPEAEAQP